MSGIVALEELNRFLTFDPCICSAEGRKDRRGMERSYGAVRQGGVQVFHGPTSKEEVLECCPKTDR